jgi:hypothetical protein
MSLLAAIANPTQANVVGEMTQGRMDTLALDRGRMQNEAMAMELEAAKAPKPADPVKVLQETKAKAELTYRVLGALGTMDPTKAPVAYAEARKQLAPMGVSLPENFDPEAVQDAIAEAAYGMEATTEMGKVIEEARMYAAQGDMKGAQAVLSQLQKYSKEPTVERKAIYSTDGAPLGLARVFSDGRIGLGGKILSEQDLQGMTFAKPEKGAAGATKTLTPAATTELQKSLINLRSQMQTMDEIAANYQDSYLTYYGKVGGFLARQASKLGMEPKPAEEFQQGKRLFEESVNTLFNLYRKDITGAAAAVKELESLKNAFMNTDLSPAEFRASYDRYRKYLELATKAKESTLAKGLDPKSKEFTEALDEEYADLKYLDFLEAEQAVRDAGGN